ncbi:MAG: aldehyde dehydrogenase family protein, partial [Acidimicrobiales bacterium]
MDVRDKLYIDGAFVAPFGSETVEVIDSTTEEVIGTVPLGSAEDVDRAAKAARAAFREWSEVGVSERAKFAARIGEALGARMGEIAELIAREVGMPLSLSMLIQAGLPIGTFSSMTEVAEQIAWEETIGNSLVVKEPVGVVGAITPWNYPLHQVAAKV